MILRSPPPLRNLIITRYGWWNLWIFATPVALGIPSELDSLANAPIIKAPALFILTDTDDVVPIGFQKKVMNAYGGQKQAVTITGGDHNAMLTPEAHRQYLLALDWLWASVPK
jgi:pimeloyl-ACP methyl ester carboxylesterase